MMTIPSPTQPAPFQGLSPKRTLEVAESPLGPSTVVFRNI